MSTEKKIIDLATKKNISIATSESITGGRISAKLTSISGSSKVFYGGVVAYSEHAKIHASGVDVRTIQEFGVYSAPVVTQMAERIAKRNIADIGIATCGLAEGSIENFEEGRVLFALSVRNKNTQLFDKTFFGDRESVQSQATEFALNIIRNELEQSR